jgi:hypothetical protein
MATAISDQALDFGLFALDNELESGGDGSEPMHYETFNQPVVEQLNWAQQRDRQQQKALLGFDNLKEEARSRAHGYE